MNWTFDVFKKVSVFLVLLLMFPGSASTEEAALSKMLNPDGSLNLESGFSGSLDPSGYRMVPGPEGEPRFVPAGTSVASLDSDPNNLYWDDQFWQPEIDGLVEALASDGAGNVYIGGWFISYGGWSEDDEGILKWNGSSYSELGAGVNGHVYAIAVDGTDVYVGGEFTEAGGAPANNVAKWDGKSWSALGSGIGGSVHAIAVKGDDVFVGGMFAMAGGEIAMAIAKWNGSSWSPLGSGMEGGTSTVVLALAVLGEDIYAGGDFTTAGGVSADYIAKWNGSSWSALGSGTTSRVRALAVMGSDLYVAAGGFHFPAGSVAKWDGSSWSALGSEVNGMAYALTVAGSDLYAGGDFLSTGGGSAIRIAKWDGSSWSALGEGLGDPERPSAIVNALTQHGGNIYAGGYFLEADGSPIRNVARWDGTRWSGLGSGISGPLAENTRVFAITVDGSNIYIGGDFYTAGGIGANNIVKWDGFTWTDLGSGTDAAVLALGASGSDVYAGGDFSTAGGVSANRIAQWNGSTWSPLGSGTNNRVRAISVLGTDVYAGGHFTSAGGVSANHIARWDGSSWHSLGAGTDNTVYALATLGTDLYAGGYFYIVDGITAPCVARWNGSSWSAVGSGPGLGVHALATDGSDLYAAGEGYPFTYCIARWDGLDWSLLGCELNNLVWGLAASRGNAYAGGSFNLAGSTTVNGVAQWDGSEWSALGTGMGMMPPVWYPDVEVLALATVGDALLAGGRFASAGGKPSFSLARWMPRVNVSHLSLAASPGEVTLGNDPHGFYKPVLMTDSGTTVSYSGGLPVDVTMEQALEIHVSGVRVNGAFSMSPSGVTFGGSGATLRVEFSEDDVAAFGAVASDFRAVRLTYPTGYPTNKEAAEVEMLSNNTAAPIRVQNGKQIYAISIPCSGISSTYGAVPLSAATLTEATNWTDYR